MKNSTVSEISRRWKSHPILSPDKMEAGVTARQEAVPGYNQTALSTANIGLAGAGGLGGEIGEGLARKGVRKLVIFDDDTVELSNLNRQKFYYPKDVYENKAYCLGENLFAETTCATEIVSYAVTLQEAIQREYLEDVDILVVGVDNDDTRVDASRFCIEKGIPAVLTGASEDANRGYVFVQKPGEACFGCVFPMAGKGKKPCPGVPAVKDILKVMGGIVLFAVDTLLMEGRIRNWNYRDFHLGGFVPDAARTVERRSNCELCGNH